MTLVLAGIIFLLTITAIVSMHSALRAGRELNAAIEAGREMNAAIERIAPEGWWDA